MESEISDYLKKMDIAKYDYNPWLKGKASSGNPDVLFRQRNYDGYWSTDKLPANVEVDLGKTFKVEAFYVEDVIWREYGAGEYEIQVYDNLKKDFVPTNPPASYKMTNKMKGHRKILSFSPVLTDKVRFIAKKGRGKQPEKFYLKRFCILPELTDELKFYQNFLATHYEGLPEENNWIGRWIWDEDIQNKNVTFRKEFEIDGDIDSAVLQGNAKNWLHVLINGISIYKGQGNPSFSSKNISEHLKTGRNIITVNAVNHEWPGGLIMDILIRLKDGRRIVLGTDDTWVTGRTQIALDQCQKAAFLPPEIYGRWNNRSVFNFRSPEIKVIEINLPEEVAAGDNCTAELLVRVSGDEKLQGQIKAGLVNAAGLVSMETAVEVIAEMAGENAKERKIVLKFTPSRYLAPGKYTLSVKEFIFEGDDNLGSLNILPPRRQIANIDAKVSKGNNGQPTIFIDGKETYPASYHYYNSMDEACGMHNSGINLYVVASSRISRSYWQGYGKYDLAGYERLLREILEMNPEAYLMLELNIDLYMPWWTKMHPEERCMLSDGRPCPTYASREADSFASKVGLSDSVKFVGDMVAHFERSPLREKIIGYRFMKGGGGEWYMWYPKHVNSHLLVPPFADHSTPMTKAYQEYLRRKYINIEALSKAWHQNISSFDAIAIPADEELCRSGFGIFRDLQKEQPVADYFESIVDVNTSYIEGILKSARNASGGKKILNVFYGYTFEFWEPRQVFSGHLGLHRLLSSGLLDSISAPHSYFNRYAGQSGAFMQPVDSISAKGVLYWDDSDFRTHFSTIDYPHEFLPQDSLSVMWRHFAMMLQKNYAFQWDPFGKWFSGPAIRKAIAAMSKLGNEFITEEQKADEPLLLPEKDRIAIVVSEKAPFVMGLETSPCFSYYLITIQREAFAKIGAPCDMLLLEELLERKELNYKAYVFLNAFSLSGKQRDIIREKIGKNGNVLAWIYAPGVYQDQSFGEENMKNITGMSLKLDNTPGPLRVKIDNTDNALTFFCRNGDVFGNNGEKISPLVYCDDQDAVTLGSYLSGNRSGLAVKDMGDWKSVFIAAPRLPASLLRGICKLAGIHLYSDEDLALYPNRRYMAIYPDRYLSAEIKFPQEVKLFNIQENKWVEDEFKSKYKLNLLTAKPYLFRLYYKAH